MKDSWQQETQETVIGQENVPQLQLEGAEVNLQIIWNSFELTGIG